MAPTPGELSPLLLLLLLAVLAGCDGRGVDEPSPRTFLQRTNSGQAQLRVMSWNINMSSVFAPDGKR